MFQLIIVDETSKASPTLESLFQGEYIVSTATPDSLASSMGGDAPPPHVVLYVSKGDISYTNSHIEQLRSTWSKAIVILLMPSVHSQAQLGDTLIPAHKILFKPCTKKRVIDTLENYRSLVTDDDESSKLAAMLATLIEFIGDQHPSLYIAYNRVSSLIMSLCNALKGDWRQIQQTFTLYILLLAYLDKDLVEEMITENGNDMELLAKVHSHIQKMVELLDLTPSIKNLADELKYILKRYDGSGYPKDDISGLNLPTSSRVINLLMDYHFLLQSGKSAGQALFTLHQREGWYDNILLNALIETHGNEGKKLIRDVYPLGLVTGMEIAEDVYGMIDGKRRKILAQNEILTDKTVDYLQRHCDDILDITEPIQIFEDLFTRGGNNDA